MATSFSAAALGAEGLAADVTMLVGNGYVPGHAAYALDVLRDECRRATTLRATPVTREDPAPQRRHPHRHRRPGHARWPSRTAGSPGSATTRTPRRTTVPTRSSTCGDAGWRPAFVDAHLHLVQTGRQLDGLDLTGCTSRQDALDRIGAHVARAARRRGRHRRRVGRDRLARPRPPHRRRPRAGGARPPALPLPRGRPLRDRQPRAARRDARRPAPRTAGPTTAGSQRRAKHTVSDRLSDLVGPGAAARRGPAGGRGAGRARHRRLPRERRPAHRPRLRGRPGPPGRRRGRAARHALLGRARRLRPGGRARACPASPATWSPTARWARAPPRCGASTPTSPATAATATSTPPRSPSTSSAAPGSGSRPASTASATPPSTPSPRASTRPPGCSATTPLRAAGAPARALRDAVGRGRGALRPARRHRQRPADVRRAVGRSRTGCTPSGWASAGAR